MKISPVGFALLGVISYLSYHAIAGNKGLSQWSRLQEQVKTLESQRDDLLLQQRQMALKIERLSEDSLDHDFLEELARQQLHFVHPGELMLEPPELTHQLPENEDLFALSNRG
ncbi:MAG: hypothetical protein CMK09_13340 [Ponticaulis sp.]|nr:hypothetical protein [Ponticaulis sp.]|tara:strand:- start:27419 stop:27757 length:339 start_codon:yes stop_codon:yes gene_type:complete